jgi:hypothetical protein
MVPSDCREADIIPFPSPALRGNRLTIRDRIEVLAWVEAARRCGYDRVVIRERHPEDDPHIGDFLSIYRAGECWATWGVARQGRALRVWRCATGADLGDFPNTEAALAAILAAPLFGEPRLRKQQA